MNMSPAAQPTVWQTARSEALRQPPIAQALDAKKDGSPRETKHPLRIFLGEFSTVIHERI